MDVWRLTIAALRRWYVLIPLLALTGVGVMLAGRQAAPEYEAEASAMIAPERRPAEIYNPYGSLAGAQEAMGIVLNSAEARQEIADQGLAWHYEVGAASRSSIIQVAARADSPAVARDTAQAVIDYAAQELAARQTEAELPEESQYTVDVLAEPALVGAVETSTLRTQAVIGALGAALALLVAVLFDDIVGVFKRSRAKRRRRPRERTVNEDDEHPGQLTLDDIPVVDLELNEPVTNGRRPGSAPVASPGDWSAPHTATGTRSPAGPRSHVSLLAEAHAEASSKVAASTANDEDTGKALDEPGGADEAETSKDESAAATARGTQAHRSGTEDQR